MPIIDAHCHLFPPELIAERERIAEREPWFAALYRNPVNRMATAEDLVGSMAHAAVDQAVVFGFAFMDAGLCHLCNQYVFEAARRYPGRLLPFIVVQPRTPAIALRELEDCLAAGALGLGELMPAGQGYALDEWPLLDPLMETLARSRRPVMLHLNEEVGHPYPGKCADGPSAGSQFALHYPDNPIILSHWGGGLPFYELMPEVHQALRNVYYDTAASTLLYDDRIFASVLNWMPTKVLWGSDYPLLGQQRFIERVQDAGLAPEHLERLLYRNTAELLGLGADQMELS